MYIHQRENWTVFRWDSTTIAPILDKVCHAQDKLLKRISEAKIPDEIILEAQVNNLTHNAIASSSIEGVRLNFDEVRSAYANKLGLNRMRVKKVPTSAYVGSFVSMMMDAMNHYDQKLTKEKLCAWQSAFFPRDNEKNETTATIITPILSLLSGLSK